MIWETEGCEEAFFYVKTQTRAEILNVVGFLVTLGLLHWAELLSEHRARWVLTAKSLQLLEGRVIRRANSVTYKPNFQHETQWNMKGMAIRHAHTTWVHHFHSQLSPWHCTQWSSQGTMASLWRGTSRYSWRMETASASTEHISSTQHCSHFRKYVGHLSTIRR